MIGPFTTAFTPATWRRQSMRHRNHPCGPAGREDRRLDRSKPPRLHFGFIASVSIIGLACKPRSAFQLCEITGVRFPAKAWSKASAARPRKASTDLKDVPWRQPARDNPGCQGSRLTSNVKGRLVCQETNRRGAQRREAGLLHPLCRNNYAFGAGRPSPTNAMGLVRGPRARTRLAQGSPPLSVAALILQLVPQAATLPAVSNSVGGLARPLARPRA